MTFRLITVGYVLAAGVLLTGCTALEPKRPAWAMDSYPEAKSATKTTGGRSWIDDGAPAQARVQPAAVTSSSGRSWSIDNAPPTSRSVNSSGTSASKVSDGIFGSFNAPTPAQLAGNAALGEQSNAPYQWEKLRTVVAPPPVTPPAQETASRSPTSTAGVGEAASMSGAKGDGIFHPTASASTVPPATITELWAKLRSAMPEITDENLRALGLVAGAAYIANHTESSATTATATTTTGSPAIPDRTVQLSPSVGMALEKLVWWGAYAGVAYMVLDPLNPNWEIEQASFPKQTYHLSLKMKRFYSGGAGEARSVFQDRAKQLMRQFGADGYKILEYDEGLNSSVIGSQRVARGVIQLTNAAG